jgi:hypothetical protein
MGAGIWLSAPLTLCQIASLSCCSGARSTLEKSIFADWAAIGALAVFSSSSDWAGVIAVNGRRFGLRLKLAVIGVAAASNWVSGPTPANSSMVRIIETVLYSVESTLPVWV